MSETNNNAPGVISFEYVEGSKFYYAYLVEMSQSPAVTANEKIDELVKKGNHILSVHFITHVGDITGFIIEYKPK